MKHARFRLDWRQYRAGQPVPADFDPGTVDALVRGLKAEWVEEPAAKAAEAPPAHKAMTQPRFKKSR